MNKKILSICIPTYNRAEFLQDTLNQILREIDVLKDDIEICVSDNASTDNTARILRDMSASLPLRWQRNKENLGYDSNVLASIKLAGSEYIWFMGDDDTILPGAIKALVDALKRANRLKHPPNAIFINEMKPGGGWYNDFAFNEFTVVEVKNLHFWLYAITFIGCICVKKSEVDKIISSDYSDNADFLHAYLHTYLFLKCLESRPFLGVIPNNGIRYGLHPGVATARRRMDMAIINMLFYFKMKRYFGWFKTGSHPFGLSTLFASGTRALIKPELEQIYQEIFQLYLHLYRGERNSFKLAVATLYEKYRKTFPVRLFSKLGYRLIKGDAEFKLPSKGDSTYLNKDVLLECSFDAAKE